MTYKGQVFRFERAISAGKCGARFGAGMDRRPRARLRGGGRAGARPDAGAQGAVEKWERNCRRAGAPPTGAGRQLGLAGAR